MKLRLSAVLMVMVALFAAGCASLDDQDAYYNNTNEDRRVRLPRWEQGVEAFYRFQDQYQRQRKPFIAYFYSTYCPYCRELENKFINTYKFARTFYWYNKVMIGTDLSKSEKDLFKEMGLRATPAFVVYPPHGRKPVIIKAYQNRYGTTYRKPLDQFMREVREALGVPRNYNP